MSLHFIIAIIIFGYVNGHNMKGSLTFVIDDTGSMSDDIDQVKEKTNQVFDAVLNSNASLIDDFIIVTFNDPDAKLYTITKDRSVFKEALAKITVDGGGDCPEYAMKGIELALEKSKPNSFFYVFTDAAAKDYNEFERIKSLGLKKSIQVTFLLTGECYYSPPEGNAVYDNLAAATNGQVFHLDKHDVRKIIDYIIETIKHKKTNLAHKNFDDAVDKKFQFTIDSKVWDVMISVSGVSPGFHITDSDGKNVETMDFINTDKSHISKLEAKPGVYTVYLDGAGYTSAVVTGSTLVCFQHGFATIPPNSLNETSTKPIAGLPSYLAIALDNIDDDIILDTIEIRDVDDNFISEFPLILKDKKQKLYVTKPVMAPKTTFKLAINGHTKTKEKITRVASTTIEPQRPELEAPKLTAPIVTILEGPKINAEYDKHLTLKCKVNAFPKPDVIWEDGSETVYPSTIVPVELPYDYLSILEIDKINKNVTIQCKAVNSMGEKTEYITVETKRKYFLTVSEFPKDATAEYGEPAEFNIKVNAFPPAKFTWYKNGDEIKNNSDYEVSSDGSKMVIKQMHQELKGEYTVEAYNEEERKKYNFKLNMSGVIPVIDKSITVYKAEKGSNVNISCKILKGNPTPVLSWQYQPEALKSLTNLRAVEETLPLNNIGLENAGTYICLAQNEFGRDDHIVDLFVEYSPTIEIVKTQMQLPEGERVILTCKVDGSPFPFVRWLFNDVEINNTGKYFYDDNSLSFTGSIKDSGIYTCEAANSLGKVEKQFYVDIFNPIKIVAPKESKLKLTVGDTITLPCLVEGYPKPTVGWTFYSAYPGTSAKPLRADSKGSITIEHIQIEDKGFYRCYVNSIEGSKSITYEIDVRAPVSILANPLGITTYNAVVGDLALRIPCNAIGSPKPVVTWETEGFNIASGTPWYDIDEKGTLIIKFPKLVSAGSYICRASNSFSSDLKEFTVNVKPYPQIGDVTETLSIETGTSKHVDCGLPHNMGDVINWFKDGHLIKSGELYLKNITTADSGVYSCRVSTFSSAHTLHKKVNVGYKPIFKNEEDTDIDFIEGSFAFLDCLAYGEPKPEINWKRNGHSLRISDRNMVYFFEMNLDNTGSYECVVSNEFGNKTRNFNIKNTEECLLDIEKDFNEHQPLLLSPTLQWPDLKKQYHYLSLPKSSKFILSCPENAITYNGKEFGEHAIAMCVDNSMFKIRDSIVDFSKIKCKKEIKSLAKRTSQSCLSGNTELLSVGFNLKRKFLRVYDVCMDKDNKIPLFTRYELDKNIADTLPKEDLKFTTSKYLPFNFDDIYNCREQRKTFYLLKGKNLPSPGNKCCFMKRQLVSPADVRPGLSQVATYNYLNVISHWSSCGTENWDEIERRIRSLANFDDINLTIYTGLSYRNTLPGYTTTNDIFLSDRFNRGQNVPKYIWKVVQNTHDKSSLAIIQMNIPNITLSEALSYMPCKDICDEVEWMKNHQWHNVQKGFTFCCSITDFASYYGTLFTEHDKVFQMIPIASNHSLI